MDKTITKRLVFIVLAVSLSGCSSDPKRTAEPEKFRVSQAKFYAAEAQSWRMSGHEGMAVYFEQKSQQEVKKQSDLDYGFFDFLIDILFDD